MFTNLLAKIESEINEVVKKQQQKPNDSNIDLAVKKNKLQQLATEYLQLEGRYKELAGLNNIY